MKTQLVFLSLMSVVITSMMLPSS